MKTGLYPMVADILHTGHVIAIEEAAKNCDRLVIALHCCPDYKNPIQSIYERYMQLRAIKWVDEVVPYTDKNDMTNLLLSYDFDVYFLGQDHEGKDFECKKNTAKYCSRSCENKARAKRIREHQ